MSLDVLLCNNVQHNLIKKWIFPACRSRNCFGNNNNNSVKTGYFAWSQISGQKFRQFHSWKPPANKLSLAGEASIRWNSIQHPIIWLPFRIVEEWEWERERIVFPQKPLLWEFFFKKSLLLFHSALIKRLMVNNLSFTKWSQVLKVANHKNVTSICCAIAFNKTEQFLFINI